MRVGGLFFSLIFLTACAQDLGEKTYPTGLAQTSGAQPASVPQLTPPSTPTPSPTPTPTPTPQPVTNTFHAIYRSYTVPMGEFADYLFSTSSAEGPGLGYTSEGTTFNFFDGASSTRLQIRRCITKGTEVVMQNGSVVGTRAAGYHFLSTNPGCEGSNVDTTLGYIEAQATGIATNTLYRCYNLDSFLETLDTTECTNIGAINQIILGYTP